MDEQIIQILFVEDNDGDALLTEEAFKEGRIKTMINRVIDGEEAMKYLYKQSPYTDVIRPDLILLDLNMPKKDGRQTLKEIKQDESLKCIPVIILTTSDAEEDVAKSYGLHANCFIRKPLDLDQFMNVIKTIEDFWLAVVRLPNRTGR